jgi:hypothetical protein
MNPQQTYSPRGAARLLHISPDRVRELIRAGRLKAINLPTRSGRPRWKITQRALAEFEQANLDAASKQIQKKTRRNAPVKDYFAN